MSKNKYWGFYLEDKAVDLSPEDSDLWMELFMDCMSHDLDDLGARLEYMRAAGCKLVPSPTGGYKIRPIIGPQAWESEESYAKERMCLMPYRSTLIILLERLKLPAKQSQ